MKPFTDLGLAEDVLRAVKAEGYTEPTPIQAAVIPALLAGQDVLGIAQTGTGKTASFVLPLLHRIAVDRPAVSGKGCGALILAPTRELAAQIAVNVKAYGRFLRLSHAIVVGGAKPGPQIRAMSKGVDILIATPGRLLDHVSTGAIRLQNTHTVVLDEADQMLDLGFAPSIRKIMGQVPKTRQTVLLSATMPKPIRVLARELLTKPREISVAPVARPIERIDQTVVHINSAGKRGRLIELLKDGQIERAIVFTRTKRGADRVSQHLEKAGFSATALHGNKSQGQRERALTAFRKGRTPILVATDIAARGIDIDDVSHVFNYELPNVPEAYVHRIGRTARAGKSGTAVSLCDPAERGLLKDIEKLIGTPIRSAGKPPAPEAEAQAPARPAHARPSQRKGPDRPSGPGAGRKKSRRTDRDGPARANPERKNNRKRSRGKPAGDGPSGSRHALVRRSAAVHGGAVLIREE